MQQKTCTVKDVSHTHPAPEKPLLEMLGGETQTAAATVHCPTTEHVHTHTHTPELLHTTQNPEQLSS